MSIWMKDMASPQQMSFDWNCFRLEFHQIICRSILQGKWQVKRITCFHVFFLFAFLLSPMQICVWFCFDFFSKNVHAFEETFKRTKNVKFFKKFEIFFIILIFFFII